MAKKRGLTCDEATAICDKNQYGEATFLEKVKLNLHLLFCKHCSIYTRQNKILTDVFNIEAKACKSQEKHLSEEEKQAIKEELNKELK